VRIFEKLAEYRYEQLVFCHDKFTGLRAVIAIHDTTLGPAPSGCRMWPYARVEETVVDGYAWQEGRSTRLPRTALTLGAGNRSCSVIRTRTKPKRSSDPSGRMSKPWAVAI
jgi:leucine dehydrogenase